MEKINKHISIILPPPNITGKLHIGHAFQQVLMDIIAKYASIKSHQVTWVPGTDHAGIAGQVAFERYCDERNIAPSERSKKIVEFVTEARGNIKAQMKKFGLSMAWEQDHFTLDPNFSSCVNKAFTQLYEDDLIYKGRRLVYFDSHHGTVLSNSEVVYKSVDSKLWYIEYSIEGSEDKILVATTRPETLFGDVAIMVHPDDIRYKHLINKRVIIPIIARVIPIITSTTVDADFGSGCVKLTPAHDMNDYVVARQHKLPLISILDHQGLLNDNTPITYRGLNTTQARKQVLIELRELEVLDKIVAIQHKVPTGERSGTLLEIVLTSQWFLSLKKMSGPLLDKIQDDQLHIYPETWKDHFLRWMSNLEDWCISRQIYWGHKIPAWFDQKGKLYVGTSLEAVLNKHPHLQAAELTQEKGSLDTWFSSCLWPLAIKGWHIHAKQVFTHDYLVTGFDILFFWIIRMSILTTYLVDQLPMKNLIVTGLIRDEYGNKMSKSRGNIINPIHLIEGRSLEDLIESMGPQNADKITKNFPEGIEAWGLDVYRLTMATIATPATTVSFDFHKMQGSKNFCTKIYNVSKYVIENTRQHAYHPHYVVCDPLNVWIAEKCNDLLHAVQKHIGNARIDLMVADIRHFGHDVFCNTYISLVKIGLKRQDAEFNQELQHTMVKVLHTLLIVLYPIVPGLSKMIEQRLFTQVAETCKLNFIPTKSASISHIETLVHLITDIRSFCKNSQELWIKSSLEQRVTLKGMQDYILGMVPSLTKIYFVDNLDLCNATFLSADMIVIGISRKLSPKQLAAMIQRYEVIEKLLTSQQFLAKASPDTVLLRQKELATLERIIALEKART